MSGEQSDAVAPEEYAPNVQEGVEYQKPKDLKAAGESHPLYDRALEMDVLSENEVQAGKTIPWNVPATVLKHMSEGLYTSNEATVREFESNGETACLRVDMWDEVRIRPDDYQPIIEVYNHSDKNKLIIRDNGIGMASATVVEVVRKIGATTVRDSGNLTGQFGMGLASFLKLIGIDNSMIIRSRSRITDENFAAYVNLGGFDPIMGGMPDGEYGTEFEMIHRGDVDRQDIREYVEKFSEWLRVPVHYEEFDEEGKQCFDEDWGGKTFIDSYSDDKMVVKLEEPGLLTAACAADAEGITLLNSMKIERNDGASSGTNKYDCPYHFDVRIEDESGSIIHVPDDAHVPDRFTQASELVGMTPVPDAEYNVMDPGMREDYIRESEVPTDAITLPVPASSRDSLQENEEFWEWLGDALRTEFYDRAEEIYNEFDGLGDILNFAGEGLVTRP